MSNFEKKKQDVLKRLQSLEGLYVAWLNGNPHVSFEKDVKPALESFDYGFLIQCGLSRQFDYFTNFRSVKDFLDENFFGGDDPGIVRRYIFEEWIKATSGKPADPYNLMNLDRDDFA